MSEQKSFILNLKQDIPASIVVFLVALPLCLGIALASGAPLFAGMIAGIIGGLVVSQVSNSHLSVTGPAAGLTAIVLSAITQLGSFEAFLLAVVLAGLLQIILGLSKSGIVANYFPSNVIKGMLTAIGIIIIMKQIPHAFGWDKDVEGDFTFLQSDGENTFTEILDLISHVSMGASLIALAGIAIILLWERPFMKRLKVIPSGLVVVLVGILLNKLFLITLPEWGLRTEQLVNLPVPHSFSEFTAQFSFPDFSRIKDTHIYMTAVTIAIVASIETLLSVEAIDKLDPEKRYTSPNRELIAQGIGNTLSGLIGGLPMTSVIVRSSANLNAGAKSKMSAFLHGFLLLVCAAFIPFLLNTIPLASLAAILIMTGYKLAKISVFKEMFDKGRQQFIPFVITVLAVVFTNLLTGVAIGMAVSVVFILVRNMKNPISFFEKTHKQANSIKMELQSEMSFLNKANIMVSLENVPENSSLILDASKTKYIDYDVLEVMREFIEVKAPARSIHLTLIGFKEEYAIENTESIYDVILADEKKNEPNDELHRELYQQSLQEKITPAQALQVLKEGNFRFVNNLKSNHNLLAQVNVTKDNQYPFAAILSCIDSRTSVELIFDQGLGDVFSIRIAGSILNDDILGSMEFACKVTGSKIIVVLGHTKCGAIKGACDHLQLGHISSLVNKIKPAVDAVLHIRDERNSHNADFVAAVAENNVKMVVEQVKERSPILYEMIQKGEIAIVGGMYDVESGVVDFYES
jgi:MFS superfamily sulfate permease-like transporter